MKHLLHSALALALVASAAAQSDGFGRERNEKTGAAKDALEGKLPPALDVTDWMNTGDKPLSLEALRGKVVVLDFWGTW